MKRFVALAVLFFITVVSSAQPVTTLRINPDYVQGGTVSQIFDSVTYIPLETTKESTFGRIQHLQISEHYFAFYDNDTKAVLIFDKKGKFLGKIKLSALDKNYDPTDVFLYIDFTLDKSSENIFIVYDEGNEKHTKKLFVFDASGKLLQSKQLSPLFNTLKPTFVFIDSNRTLFASENEDTTSKYYFHIVKNFDSVVSDLVSKRSNDPLSSSRLNSYILQSSSPNGSIWSRAYDYAICHISPAGLVGFYKVLFPQSMSLDSSFYNPSVIGNKENTNTYLKQYQNKVNFFVNVYNSKNLLYFALVRYMGAFFRDNYFYSLKTNNLYSLYNLTPDVLSCFLRVFNDCLVGADDTYIYSQMPSYLMFKSYEDNKDKHPQYPPVLQNYFATQSRKSNPVIVQLKPKENL